MCPKSYALGRWRGTGRLQMGVPLHPDVCLDSYSDGYNHGLREPERRAPSTKRPRR